MTDDFDAHYQKLDGLARTAAREAEAAAVQLLRGLGYMIIVPITPEVEANVLSRYQAGESVHDIAAALGTSHARLLPILRRHNVVIRGSGARKGKPGRKDGQPYRTDRRMRAESTP